MTYPNNIVSVHLDLTDKCPAACPMCPRNDHGGIDMPYIKNIEMTLENVKQWLTPEWINTIDGFHACGLYGEPLMAKDCLAIFEYLMTYAKSDCQFKIYTNGSLRPKDFWIKAANLFNKNNFIIFAIDGFKGEHELYRRNTSWDKIISNAKIFIEAGGNAQADVLLFKHNEDRIHELKSFLLNMGFSTVNIKRTERFLDKEKFPVKNKSGDVEYYLEPPTSQKVITHSISLFKNLTDTIQTFDIDPKCRTELYINATGDVFPCCAIPTWLDHSVSTTPTTFDEFTNLHQFEAADRIIKDVGYINLKDTDIATALAKSNWANIANHHITGNKSLVCAANCSTGFFDNFKI
jgi:MoaA/NifB/PqqE/SkfB family radical SAM enzyme